MGQPLAFQEKCMISFRGDILIATFSIEKNRGTSKGGANRGKYNTYQSKEFLKANSKRENNAQMAQYMTNFFMWWLEPLSIALIEANLRKFVGI